MAKRNLRKKKQKVTTSKTELHEEILNSFHQCKIVTTPVQLTSAQAKNTTAQQQLIQEPLVLR